MSPSNISEVNSLDREQFVSTFHNVIELCADAAEQVEKKRPFRDLDDLCEAFQVYLDQLDTFSKVEILKLHPDLAGRLAASGGLTKESSVEQQSAGLDQLSDEQKRTIDIKNESYKTKFGFPFIICARENKVPSIIKGLQERYFNTPLQEISTAIEEIKKICKLRILDLVK